MRDLNFGFLVDVRLISTHLGEKYINCFLSDILYHSMDISLDSL